HAWANFDFLDALVGHERIEFHRHVELALVERGHRAAAGDDTARPRAAANAAAHFPDHLAQRNAHRQFVDAWLVHVAGNAQDARAARLAGAQAGEPLAAFGNDVGDVHQRLDVVDDGRHPEQALDGRKRGLQPWPAALAFQRVQERRFFTADIRARAAMHRQLELPRPDRGLLLFAEQAFAIRLVDGGDEDLGFLHHLAADVDVRGLAAQRVRGDEDALDQ